MLDMKNSSKTKTSGTGKGSLSYGDLIFAARESVTRNHIPMLDNTEIIVASKVPKERTAETALEKDVREVWHGRGPASRTPGHSTAFHASLPTRGTS